MEKTPLNITLTVQQVNVIFSALGKLPFDSVFELIKTLKEQADAQFIAAQNAPQPAQEEPKTE